MITMKTSINRRFVPVGAALILSLMCLGGCTSGQATKVTGQVTLDGAPLEGANLQLVGASDPSLGMHSTSTDAQGKFTFSESGDSTTPIKNGSYVVLVSKRTLPPDAASLPGGGMGADKEIVPAIYQDKEKSPLKVEVNTAKMELPAMQLSSK